VSFNTNNAMTFWQRSISCEVIVPADAWVKLLEPQEAIYLKFIMALQCASLGAFIHIDFIG
jgi:hypothetical protein